MPIVVILRSEETLNKLSALLVKWFGGTVTVEPFEGEYQLTMPVAADKYEKAQYFCIGFVAAHS